MKFYQNETLVKECGLIPIENLGLTPGYEAFEDEYLLEKAIVEHFKCSSKHPLCLYDFTTKKMMTDFLAFAVPNLFDSKIDEFFYEPDYSIMSTESKQNFEIRQDVDSRLIGETPRLFEEEFKLNNTNVEFEDTLVD